MDDKIENNIFAKSSFLTPETSFSVGELSVRLDIELDRLRLDDTDNVLGYCDSCSVSSPGNPVSTIASRQLTNSSALSGLAVA